MSKQEFDNQMQIACGIVAEWPEWKQNLLEQSAKPTVATPRTPVINRRCDHEAELATLRTQLAASQAECERLRKVVRELVKAGELASITVQDFMNDLRERDAEIERLNSTLDGLRCKDCNERFDDDGCCECLPVQDCCGELPELCTCENPTPEREA